VKGVLAMRDHRERLGPIAAALALLRHQAGREEASRDCFSLRCGCSKWTGSYGDLVFTERPLMFHISLENSNCERGKSFV